MERGLSTDSLQNQTATSMGDKENLLPLKAVEQFRGILLSDEAFMDSFRTAWHSDSGVAHVRYAKNFERLLAMTPVFKRDMDHMWIAVIDPEKSTMNTPIFKLGKQICGAPGVQRDVSKRNALKHMYRCLRGAGEGTEMDEGRCISHPVSTKVQKHLGYLGKKGMALRLKEYMELNPDAFKNTQLGSLDREIRIMEFLLNEFMEEDFTPTVVMDIIERQEKLKTARMKLEVDKYMIDPKQIQLFIRGILQILRQTLPEDLYNEVIANIEAKVPVPTNKAMVELLGAREIDADYDVGTEKGDK